MPQVLFLKKKGPGEKGGGGWGRVDDAGV